MGRMSIGIFLVFALMALALFTLADMPMGAAAVLAAGAVMAFFYRNYEKLDRVD